MGFATCYAPCGQCGRAFSFHPNFVPSLNNIPFCRSCIEAANPTRKEKGLAEIKIHPRAYDIADEEEIP